MPEITAKLVQELREATNLGMMDCKKALAETNGDKDAAIRLLRERGLTIAMKKASRTANQGLIAATIGKNSSLGAIIEVNCETDFAARNASFVSLVSVLAAKALETDAPLSEVCSKELVEKTAEIGEHLVIRRNVRYQLKGNGAIVSYIHPGSKLGVLLELNSTKTTTAAQQLFADTAKDLCMHIAACSPPYLTSTDIPAAVLAAERDIYAKQVTNKPPQIVDKIVDGKIKKYYSQVCLLDQPFVKDQALPVSGVLQAAGKQLEDTLTVARYQRYQLGQSD